MFDNIYKNRRVLITGHTGFKGSWLCSWLLDIGATVAGYSINIPTQPSHFEALNLVNKIKHFEGDIRDKDSLQQSLDQFCPEIIFHFAGQPLVRESYEDPALTFETNVMGTLNLLDCLRNSFPTIAAILITSDKCYENIEWLWGYRENDRLGGKDPYSASKACAEIVSKAYMESFFEKTGPRIATTRAGNVIGGGDWAVDRVIPDCARAWSKGEPVIMRYPSSIRPWQHVLEPLSGYLTLGQKLFQSNDSKFKNQSFNFGPLTQVNQSVAELVTEMAQYWPNAKSAFQQEINSEKPESNLLKLNCDKALQILGWKAVLNFEETVSMTGKWYQVFYDKGPSSIPETTSKQIWEYIQKADESNLPWVK
jgi:CDP-glucose 4,6-dehydratase